MIHLGYCQQLVGTCKEMAGIIPHQQNPRSHNHNNSAFIILALCIQQTHLGPWCRSKKQIGVEYGQISRFLFVLL